MFVGRMVQLAATTGLVQMIVFPPAFPETERPPVQGVPFVFVELKVNLPENSVAVVLPATVPFAGSVPVACQVPVTASPACVRVMVNGPTVEPLPCTD
jgi:hypothetical protein